MAARAVMHCMTDPETTCKRPSGAMEGRAGGRADRKRCLEVSRMDAQFELEQPAVGHVSGER